MKVNDSDIDRIEPTEPEMNACYTVESLLDRVMEKSKDVDFQEFAEWLREDLRRFIDMMGGC